jgi:hypothetical protein
VGRESGSGQLATYRCPGCQAALQGRADRPGAWLRCPRCGRASRSPVPEPAVEPKPVPVPMPERERYEPPPIIWLDETSDSPPPITLTPLPRTDLAEPASPKPARVAHVPIPPSALAPPVHVWRVIHASVLFVSVTMLLFSYLDRSIVGVSIFGTVAFFCLVLLVFPGRPGR